MEPNDILERVQNKSEGLIIRRGLYYQPADDQIEGANENDELQPTPAVLYECNFWHNLSMHEKLVHFLISFLFVGCVRKF